MNKEIRTIQEALEELNSAMKRLEALELEIASVRSDLRLLQEAKQEVEVEEDEI